MRSEAREARGSPKKDPQPCQFLRGKRCLRTEREDSSPLSKGCPPAGESQKRPLALVFMCI